ncbi:hypothetical protein I5P78_26065 [Serratia marcescens]|nr:hypothetical protein [Serratia marcescens]
MVSPRRRVAALPLLGLAATLLLSGCENTRRTLPATQQDSAATAGEKTQAQKESDRLAQCQKELDALKGINNAQYTAYLVEFQRLMRGAAQYAGLRAQVNNDTQDMVDALYRYKINRLCADITQAALTGLAERGEHLK